MVALTIGMATYNDFDGVYFTLQALRLYQDLQDTELLVVDNYGCEHTQRLVEGWVKGRYIRATEAIGTAAPRDLVFQEASGEAVLCCDSHVLFAPGAIARLKAYYRENPDSRDLLQGPLMYDGLETTNISTHFEPNWRDQMWGTWATDPRGLDPEGEPFEIPMQGLGVFSCRKYAWLGFNPHFRGFGGEEGYIHEKFRQAGGRCLCLPWLRWVHRFGRPAGVPYPLFVEDKLRNYIIGHAELGLDLEPIVEHFSGHLPEDVVVTFVTEALRIGIGSRRNKAIDNVDQDGAETVAPAPDADVVLFVVGDSGPDGASHPPERDFPLLNREDGESAAVHLVRVIHFVEDAMAAGATHLLVPREDADWLGDHPLLVEYFAEFHELAAASDELGIVLALRS